VPLETRKVYRSRDITTHYSAPELNELIPAANRVCEKKSGTGSTEEKVLKWNRRVSVCFGRL